MCVRVLTERRFHSKAYIFKRQNSDLAIVGSSNMTRSGLTDNIELNLMVKDRQTIQALEKWFDELWNAAEDLSLQLLQVIEVSKTYEYVRTGLPSCLYLAPLDFFKTLIKAVDREYLLTEEGLLLPFQELDYKISMETISQYGGVIIASSVGLGKSYVACRIIKDYYSQGKRVLLIIPPNLREQWEGYLRLFDIPPSRIAMVSMFELSKSDFDREVYRGFDMILVDESHNFRNPASNRTKNFMKSVKNSKAVYILLSATPINNSLGDLLTQVDMFMVPERFKAGGIQSLYADLAAYVRSGDPSLRPSIVQLRSKTSCSNNKENAVTDVQGSDTAGERSCEVSRTGLGYKELRTLRTSLQGGFPQNRRFPVLA